MPVNFAPPVADQLLPVKGVRLGTAEANIRKPNRKDLCVIELAAGSTVAGVFTQNRFCAAPVQICKQNLVSHEIRALVINTGCANAGTGESGFANAQRVCAAVARGLDLQAQQILPFSTGVILEDLPVDRIEAGLPQAFSNLEAAGWFNACHAIMTTDTVPKAASRTVQIDGSTITLTGMSKGAGMIRPNMATMLSFIATDAAISQPLLNELTREVADASFNSITVDGDTSTNDSFIVIATGAAGASPINDTNAPAYKQLRAALLDLAIWLAQAIVRDGEGATKFISVQVQGGKTREECRQVAYAIAHSPLVKTAFFASDPNLGRILAAVGYAGIKDLDVATLRVWLASRQEEILVAEHGGRTPSYREVDGARIMEDSEITIRIDLARGDVEATVWTCDFSYDYVKINADYRS